MKRYKKSGGSYRLLLASLCLILSASAFHIGLARLNGEAHTKRALAARSEGKTDDVIRETDLAVSYLYNVDPTAAPLRWYSGVAHFTSGRLNEARHDFEEAMKAHPNHIYVLHNLGTCAEQMGDHSYAIEMYERTLEIAPHFDEALANLSIVYYNIKEYEKALSLILRCNQKSLSPKLMRYIENLRRMTNGEVE